MRIGCFFLVASVFMASCGLEGTVESLPDPPVDYSIQLNPSMLTFTYQTPSSTAHFQGYEVFYKIYTSYLDSTSNTTRLLADRDLIWLSPTVSNLQANGYLQFTMSTTQFNPVFNANNTTPNSRSPAIISGMQNGDTVAVDFTSFLGQNQNQIVLSSSGPIYEPQISFTSQTGSPQYLYRAAVVSPAVSSFWNLAQNANNVDIFDSPSVAKSNYAINIFIVAYGVTDTLQQVTSRPVPWGVIGNVDYTSSIPVSSDY